MSFFSHQKENKEKINQEGKNLIDLRNVVLGSKGNNLELKKKLKSKVRKVSNSSFYRFKKAPKHHYWILLVLLVLFSFLGIYNSFVTRADITHFFAQSCLGSWKNPTNAEGEPQALKGDPKSFTRGNSAIAKAGQLGEIFCGSFQGEVLKGAIPQKATLKLSWFWKEQGALDSPEFIIKESAEDTEEENQNDQEDQEESGPPEENLEETDDTKDPKDQVSEKSQKELKEKSEEEEAEVVEVFEEVEENNDNEAEEEEGSGSAEEESGEETEESQEENSNPNPDGGDSPDNTPSEEESAPQANLFLPKEIKGVFFHKVFAEETGDTEDSGNNILEEDLEESPDSSEDSRNQENVGEGEEMPHQPNQKKPPEDSPGLFEIKYTFDGQEWVSLGTVSTSNWRDAEFDLPVVDWEKMSEIQIAIQKVNQTESGATILSLDEMPEIFLDAVWIEISYLTETVSLKPSPEELEELKLLPKKQVNWRNRFVSKKTTFRAGENVFFEFDISDFEERGESLEKIKDGAGKELKVNGGNMTLDKIEATEEEVEEEKSEGEIEETNSENQEEKTEGQENQKDQFDGEGGVSGEGQQESGNSGEQGSEGNGNNSSGNSGDSQEEGGGEESSESSSDQEESSEENGGEKEESGEDGNGGGQAYNPWWKRFSFKNFFSSGTIFAQPFSRQDLTLVSSLVSGPSNKKLDIKPEVLKEKGRLRISLPDLGDSFKPGKYYLEVEMAYRGELLSLEQEFAMGVLAVNLNKSIFNLGDKGYFQMAVLTDSGNTVCDADLELRLVEPDGIEQTLSTQSGDIIYGDDCGLNNVTDEPDYFFYRNLLKSGTYNLTLTNLDNGYFIEDSFEVGDNFGFDVERVGATRINPFRSAYKMTLYIKPDLDFNGIITEEVPASFELKENKDFNVKKNKNSKFISWQVDLKAGEKKELSYIYQAPEISPQFYLLGPLEIGESKNLIEKMFSQSDDLLFKEARQWQIASDAEVISTIGQGTCGGGSCDYSTVQAWWDDVRSSTNAAQWGEVHSGGAVGGWNQTSMDNATPTSSAYPRLYAANNHGHEGKKPSNFNDIAFLDGGITLTVDHTTVGIVSGEVGEGLYVQDTGGPALTLSLSSGVQTFTIDGNIFEHVAQDGSFTHSGTVAYIGNAQSGSEATINVSNSVFFSSGTDSTSSGTTVLVFSRTQSSGTRTFNINHVTVEHSANTASTSPIGLRLRADTGSTLEGNVKNSYAVSFSSQGTHTWNITASHNASENTSATSAKYDTVGSTGIINLNPADQFTSPGSDWSLLSTADLVDSGTFVLDYDAISTVRPQGSEVDIGALEFFESTVEISGNVYGNFDTSSVYSGCDGSTENISLIIDGGTASSTTSCNGTTGAYSFSVAANDITSGDEVSVFINQTNKGATVALADGNNMTGMDIGQNDLRFSSDGSATALTNTNLDHCDDDVTDCSNVPYDVTTGNLTVESGIRTVVESGRSFTPGGGVSLVDLEIAGTLTAPGSSNDFNISGDFDNSGTFTHNSGTTTFDATSTGNTIDSGGDEFNNVVFDGSGGGWSPATSTMVVAGSLTLSNGSFNTDNGTANVTVKGSVECGATCGVINMTSTNTFTHSISDDKNFGTNVATSTDWTFYNLTFNTPCTGICGSSETSTLNGTGTGKIIVGNNLSLTSAGSSDLILDNNTNDRIIEVGGDVTIGSGATLSSSSSASFNVGGSWSNSGTFTHNNGEVTFDASSSGQTISTGGSNFYDATFDNASGGWTLQSNTTITNILDVNAGTLNAGSNTITLSGSGTPFLVSGTFNADTSDIRYTSDASTNVSALDYFDLSLVGGSVTAPTYTLGTDTLQTINVGGDLTLGVAITNSVSVTGNTYAPILDIDGDVTIVSGSTLIPPRSRFNVGGNFTNSGTYTHNSGTITFDAISTGKTINSGGSNFNNVVFDGSGGGWSPATSTMVVVGNLTLSNGSFNTDNGTANVEVRGNVRCGASTCGVINMTSTNTFTQSISVNRNFGTSVAVATDWTFNNLVFHAPCVSSCTSPVTVTFNGSGTGKIITKNNLSLTSAGGASLIVNNNTNDRILEVEEGVSIGTNTTLSSSSSANFLVGGNWSNSGTFTHNSGTVTFNSTSVTERTISDGGSSFYNLVFNGTGGEWLYQDGANTAPNLTSVNDGTATFLNAKTGTVSMGDDGTIRVDWYLAVKTVAGDDTSFDVEISDGDITISENSGTPQETIFRHNGSTWGSASSTQVTGTGSDGFNPQPNSAGAIRIREYSQACSGGSCGGIDYYRYNLDIVSQAGFNSYDFQNLTGKYLVSSDKTPASDEAAVISESWYRSTVSSANSFTCSAGSGDDCLNEPPDGGSWYAGLVSDLTFSVDSATANLGTLNFLNDFTSTASTTLSVSTSFSDGYTVTAYASNSGQLKLDGESVFINAWSGSNGTPTAWDGICEDNSQCGFGYTTSDSNLSGGTADRFTNNSFCSAQSGNQCWAGFVGSNPGDPVADSAGAVPSGENTTVTYRVSAPYLQQPGNYVTTIFYIASANY